MAEEEDDEPTAPFWLTTYSDMVTLLLTFFVMIVAMSEIKKDRLMEALSFFTGRTSVFENAQPIPVYPGDSQEEEERVNRAEQVEVFVEEIKQMGLEDKVEVNFKDATMHVVITDSVMFSSGSTRLENTAQRVLSLVTGVLTEAKQTVTVIGHTDNQPINTFQFPSNWELSASRAASVVRYMLTQDIPLSPDNFQAVGKGEFEPVASNRTASGRSRNRRIELLISWDQWQNQSTNPQMERKILTP